MGEYRVAVIGGMPAPIHGAKELGIDVVLVHEEGKYEPSILAHTERVVHAPLDDGPAIHAALSPLHAERPFDRVMTTTEVAAISSGYVVDMFGLPGVTEFTARALKDKSLTRECLAKADVENVRYQVVNSVEEAVSFLEQVGGKIVLKPIDGAASLHIKEVGTPEQVAEAMSELAAAGITAPMAEEFLSGPVVSVDSFSFEGRHLTIGYSEYRMNDRFVEWEVSTPSRVAVPHLADLRELTAKLLDAVGVTEGPSHSEFVLTPNGPRVLESHARLAGSGAPELVRRAFGLDLNRMFLTVPLGIDELPLESPAPIGGAVALFLTPKPGPITSITVSEDIPATVRRIPPGESARVFMPYLFELGAEDTAVVITKNPGDEVAPLLTVADCSNGYILASGTDALDAIAKAEAINAKIDFVTG
ncbi:ATP-grasp domain-containing protein [Micromonospora sp. NPDC003241]